MVHKGSSGDPTREERAERARQRGQEKARRERLLTEVNSIKTARLAAQGKKFNSGRSRKALSTLGNRQLRQLGIAYETDEFGDVDFDYEEADHYH